jgi:hypothetical protein
MKITLAVIKDFSKESTDCQRAESDGTTVMNRYNHRESVFWITIFRRVDSILRRPKAMIAAQMNGRTMEIAHYRSRCFSGFSRSFAGGER